MGEALIDFLSVGAVDGVEQFRKQPGGAPLNVACGVARLGAGSAFVGKLGDDLFGRFLVDVARREGVDVSGVPLTTEAKTGLAFVSLDEKGERSFAFYRDPAADMLLRPEDLPSLVGCRALHHGSISLITSPSREATLAARERARAAGAFVSYDPNLRPALWPSLEHAKRAIKETLAGADVVKVSKEELDFVVDGDAGRILDAGARVVFVTDGAAGARVVSRDGSFAAPAFRVDAVDSTGAGDAFCAGYLTRLVERGRFDRDALVDAATWGAAAGAICCTGRGAIDPLPTRATLETFLAARPRR